MDVENNPSMNYSLWARVQKYAAPQITGLTRKELLDLAVGVNDASAKVVGVAPEGLLYMHNALGFLIAEDVPNYEAVLFSLADTLLASLSEALVKKSQTKDQSCPAT